RPRDVAGDPRTASSRSTMCSFPGPRSTRRGPRLPGASALSRRVLRGSDGTPAGQTEQRARHPGTGTVTREQAHHPARATRGRTGRVVDAGRLSPPPLPPALRPVPARIRERLAAASSDRRTLYTRAMSTAADTGPSSARADVLTLSLAPGERWWGGRVTDALA